MMHFSTDEGVRTLTASLVSVFICYASHFQ